jgi:hypothetical protein
MTDTTHTLKQVRDLLADPSRWTKGEFARNAKGKCTLYVSKDAVCFCLDGALMRVTTNDPTSYRRSVNAVREAISRRHYRDGYITFNDDPNANAR